MWASRVAMTAVHSPFSSIRPARSSTAPAREFGQASPFDQRPLFVGELAVGVSPPQGERLLEKAA